MTRKTDETERYHRRRALAMAGGVLAVGLAGCSSLGGEGEDGGGENEDGGGGGGGEDGGGENEDGGGGGENEDGGGENGGGGEEEDD
ncbi:hypothetical protein [Halococcus salsus]|uniref:hypothetical protein n=1 Tax=Halococcus salsus TaxID=2162894 RepID=UPI001F04D414|nr:hypothetical protein [Halococcus salsus]